MPKVTRDELAEIDKRTRDIEAEKEAKRLEREEKKRLKELQKRRESRERLVAPILLIMTLLASILMYFLYR